MSMGWNFPKSLGNFEDPPHVTSATSIAELYPRSSEGWVFRFGTGQVWGEDEDQVTGWNLI